MKKISISLAAFATFTFVAFAFAPVKKNKVIDDSRALKAEKAENATSTCDYKDTTSTDFTSCVTHSSNGVIAQEFKVRSQVLENY